ncbi:predicted protein [Postia placenta Mad-698-R]|nr:predicted protein [Postia placenta Mad-698-R]
MLVLATSANSVLAARALTAVSLTIYVWDHLLNIADEVELVWRQPWSVVPVFLTFNRHAEAVGWWSTELTEGVCQALAAIISVYCVINSASTQFTLLLYLYNIWDSSRTTRRLLTYGFVVCFSISLVFAAVSLHDVWGIASHISFFAVQSSRRAGSITPFPKPRFCAVSHMPKYSIGMWGGLVRILARSDVPVMLTHTCSVQILYDFYVLVLIVVNALQRPRRHDSEIIGNLFRDGGYMFMCSGYCSLSPACLQTVLKNAPLDVVPVVAWVLDSVVSYRLFLRTKAIELNATKAPVVGAKEASVYVYEEVDVEMM